MTTPVVIPFRPNFLTCSAVTPQCPVIASTYGDYFSLGGCVIFITLFVVCLIAQIGIGAWGRTWSFSLFLGIGTAFELMGYAARLSMTSIGTVWNYPSFVIQLVMLILAPTMIAAAISVTFKWVVIYVDPKYSIFQPKWYPWVFIGTDFISIIIQAAGGAISAGATDNPEMLDIGTALMVGGTAFQAAIMAFCGGLMGLYWWRYTAGKRRGETSYGARDMGTSEVKEVKRRGYWPETTFQVYLYAILVAYIAILVRCIYRIPEMSSGWGSDLMRDETLFMVLDGAMIATAIVLLTVIHPALFFPILRDQSKGGRMAPSRTRKGAGYIRQLD